MRKDTKVKLVGLPGFEPESIEPKSTSLDQAVKVVSGSLLARSDYQR